MNKNVPFGFLEVKQKCEVPLMTRGRRWGNWDFNSHPSTLSLPRIHQLQFGFSLALDFMEVSVVASCDSLYSPVSPTPGTAVCPVTSLFWQIQEELFIFQSVQLFTYFKAEWWLPNSLHTGPETRSQSLFIILFIKVQTSFVRFIVRHFWHTNVINDIFSKIFFNSMCLNYRKTLNHLPKL